MAATPDGSTLVQYGALSGQKVNLALADSRQVEGFFLPNWMATKHPLQILMNLWQVRRLAAHELQTTIQKRLPLAAVQTAITLYQANSTAGKVLLVADSARIQIDK